MIPGPPPLEKFERKAQDAAEDRRAIAYCLLEGVILQRLDKGWVFLDEDTQERILFFHPPTCTWSDGEQEGEADDLWFAIDVALEIHRDAEVKPKQREFDWEKGADKRRRKRR